jgi:alkylation response protein AidB-like acyl-CoA dehydrogenase
MDLALTTDQTAILDAVESLARPFAGPAVHEAGFALVSDRLDRALEEGGFLDVAFDPDLGAGSAALVVERLARLPYAVEAAASALVRPLFPDLPRPFCLVMEGRRTRPIRFLKAGATVIVVGQDKVSRFIATEDQVRAEDTLFGYPMGGLRVDPAAIATTAQDVSPEAVTTRWRVAIAAEAAGLLAAALDSTTTYVTDRQQFGRPLATFQALRHRLAEAQVRANGVYWLAMKAAGTLDAGDAALAALHAQESARATVYDFHQFLGAMGMTLEHPLHLWTYRLKALIGELGGRGGQGLAAAEALWG